MKKHKRIILNYLPPSRPDMPSISLSVLKSFMKNQGYEIEIIYWNVLFKELFSKFYKERKSNRSDFFEEEILQLLPFISLILKGKNDPLTEKRIQTYLVSIFPKYQLENNLGNFVLNRIEKEVSKLIDIEMQKFNFDNILLIGFSSKYFQWIPGMLFAKEFKKILCDINIVIGGFGTKAQAEEILGISKYFDFAIWGEGEYPLLSLSNYLNERSIPLETIPRLAYREKGIIKVNNSRSQYISFDSYRFPDYEDFEPIIKIDQQANSGILLPIESKRGCHWQKCKFCSINLGYKYRARDPLNVIEEITQNYKKYGITCYYFVDSDFVGDDIHYFERFLDAFIEFNIRYRIKFNFFIEVIHGGINPSLVQKMSIAGFNKVQIGYEANSDKLLKKMRKKVDFADHLIFIKFCTKYGISVQGANIIRGIIGETKEDVIESIQNLVYLRFYLNKKNEGFRHNISRLLLQRDTPFYFAINKNEKENWNFHPIAQFFPKDLINEESRLILFGGYKELDNKIEWEWFEKVSKYYEENEFNYKILKDRGRIYYNEYVNGNLIEQIVFIKPEYYQVLKLANDKILSLDDIYGQLEKMSAGIEKGRLVEAIEDLMEKKLIYVNDNKSRIITIIDVSSW